MTLLVGQANRLERQYASRIAGFAAVIIAVGVLIISLVLVSPLHGPRLRLTPASAQAIGLALHELATNAGKYGALSTDKGDVDIGWSIDNDTFSMSWIERDGPPVSAPKRRGFGTIVMEAMAERSVGGAVDLDYAPSGLTWRLTCSVANTLEPWNANNSGDPENRIGKVKERTTA